MILLLKGEPLGGKGLTGPICPSLFLNSFPPKPANASPFVILLCLMPDYFILSNARTNSSGRVFSKVHPKVTTSFFTYSPNKHHKTMTWDLKDGFPWLNVVLNIIRIVLYPGTISYWLLSRTFYIGSNADSGILYHVSSYNLSVPACYTVHALTICITLSTFLPHNLHLSETFNPYNTLLDGVCIQCLVLCSSYQAYYYYYYYTVSIARELE